MFPVITIYKQYLAKERENIHSVSILLTTYILLKNTNASVTNYKEPTASTTKWPNNLYVYLNNTKDFRTSSTHADSAEDDYWLEYASANQKTATDSVVFFDSVKLSNFWPNSLNSTLHANNTMTKGQINMNDGKWNLDIEQVFDACDSNTSAIVINSPNNPSGWTMSNQEQKTILEFARKKGLWIVSDEVYARISFKNNHAPSFCEVMEKDDRVNIVNSF